MIELTDPKITEVSLPHRYENQYFVDLGILGAFDEKKACRYLHLFSGIRTSMRGLYTGLPRTAKDISSN